MTTIARVLLPSGASSAALPMLIARGLRAFSDGYVAVLLPAYLLALGFGRLDVGFLSTATLAGSALTTLTLGAIGHRWASRHLLLGAALLMTATGVGFASLSSYWPLLVVAFFGTLNPSSGDASLFLPLEYARLAHAAKGHARTALYARYTLVGSLCAAFGALSAAIPPWLASHAGLPLLHGLRAMFVLYSLIGAAIWLLYRKLPVDDVETEMRATPLGPSRGIVVRLAALFSIDAFAGGLIVHSLLVLWLFERFGLSIPQAAMFFFVTGLLASGSQLLAPLVARRAGLINAMVVTQILANVCLILAAFAPNLGLALTLLFMRSALSQIDVPVRTAFVMAVVTPAERAAAASFTAVPRSLASAASPTLSGALLAAGLLSAPLVACGVLKIAYDVALLVTFRRVKVPRDGG